MGFIPQTFQLNVRKFLTPGIQRSIWSSNTYFCTFSLRDKCQQTFGNF